jgi:HSP20 family molecular chaperone IbpA
MDKRIPVKLSDNSVLDTEFSSIRERFDAEMRRMEEEMNSFRSQLLQRQDNFFNKPSSFLSDDLLRDSSSSFRTSSQTQSSQQHLSTSSAGNILDGLNSPLIQDDGDGKSLKLRFDVSQYAPEEIVLKTVDNKLLVHAKHEEKSETKSVYREYNREFLLPSGVNPELIRSSLSKDGVLTVEAPLPQQALPAPK